MRTPRKKRHTSPAVYRAVLEGNVHFGGYTTLCEVQTDGEAIYCVVNEWPMELVEGAEGVLDVLGTNARYRVKFLKVGMDIGDGSDWATPYAQLEVLEELTA